MLRGVMCVLVRAGVGRVRAQVLESRLAELGAHLQEQPAPSTTHVFAAVPFSSLSAHLQTPVPNTARFYSLDWLTESIRLGKPLPADQYLLPSSPGWTPAAVKKEPSPVKLEEKPARRQKLEPSSSYGSLAHGGPMFVKSEVKMEVKTEVKPAEALFASLSAPTETVQLRYSPLPEEEEQEDYDKGFVEPWATQLPTQSQDVQRVLAFLHTRRLADASNSSSSAEVPRLSPSSLSPHLSPKKGGSSRKAPAVARAASELSPTTSPRMSPLSPDRDLSQIYTLTQKAETDEEAEVSSEEDSPKKKKSASLPDKKRKELEAYTDVKPWMTHKRAVFACQRPSSAPIKTNHNEALTKLLGQLEESTKSTGDKWRAYSYRKAITVLRNLPRPIRTAEEARQLRGVGESIAEKIAEILATGRLRKAENRDEFTSACEIFSKVWGAGPETLKRWYGCGYRTLADLRAAPPEALNAQQRVGLKHYENFLLRIPRAEVTEIEARVLVAAQSLAPDVRVVTCGSYRRGKPDCGDVDILLSNRSGSSLHGFMINLVKRLHATGLLTDDLSHPEKDDQDKYFGVCQLSPQHPHRRLDFQLIPTGEWPFALLYFTGSDHFNRSMRLWAKKNGMSLSEKALVRRLSEDMKGAPLPNINTEEEIFTALGLHYIPPEERNV